MKSPPKGWPRLSISLFYDDAAAAIDWLCTAFGFEVVLKIEGEGGKIEHSQLTYHGGLVMISSAGRGQRPDTNVSPRAIGGKNTHAVCIYLDDVDAHCERARKAGAEIIVQPNTDDYGDDYWCDRSYQALDPEGNQWAFVQRLRGES